VVGFNISVGEHTSELYFVSVNFIEASTTDLVAGLRICLIGLFVNYSFDLPASQKVVLIGKQLKSWVSLSCK
jgi:hypothetical protein